MRLLGALPEVDAPLVGANISPPTYSTKSLPLSVSWMNIQTPVKQQFCGDCWAAAGAALIESLNTKKTGKSNLVSRQELIDCVTGNNGCNGGIPAYTLKYIDEKGVMDEVNYPYLSGQEGACARGTKPAAF